MTFREAAMPQRIVVGANGAYWRDFGTHYSMCVVSEDNDPVVPMAVYVRLDFDDFMDRRDDERLRAMGVEPAPRDLNDPSDEGPAPTGACHVHPGMPPHPAHR